MFLFSSRWLHNVSNGPLVADNKAKCFIWSGMIPVYSLFWWTLAIDIDCSVRFNALLLKLRRIKDNHSVRKTVLTPFHYYINAWYRDWISIPIEHFQDRSCRDASFQIVVWFHFFNSTPLKIIFVISSIEHFMKDSDFQKKSLYYFRLFPWTRLTSLIMLLLPVCSL